MASGEMSRAEFKAAEPMVSMTQMRDAITPVAPRDRHRDPDGYRIVLQQAAGQVKGQQSAS
jgi:hypothetical protein